VKDLTEGKEGKLILNFALPMLLGNVFQQLYNVVDSIIVGKVLGSEALAAVGASFPLIFTLISLVVGIAMGATIIVAQYYGAKNMDLVKKTVDTLNIFMFFASIVLMFVGIYSGEYIFRLISLPEDVIPLAVDYFTVYSFGYVFFFGFQGMSAILRGLGDSRTPVYFVAAATIIAQAGAFFTLVFYIDRYHSFLDFSPFKMKFDREIFKKSLAIGLPSGIQHTFVAVGFLALYRIVNMFGTPTIAAYTIAMRIDSFAVLPAMNFSAAITSFTGQNIGANKMDRLSNGLKSSLKMMAVVSVSITALAIVFATPIVSLFTNDPEVVHIGKDYLYIVSPFYVVFASLFVMMGLLRGAGDTITSMIITIISLWLIRIPASYVLSVKFGTIGIWWGIPVAWIIGLTFSYFYYKTGRWKKKAIVKHKPEEREL
jgi:Na+-driven multidrug efflux pump